MPAISNPGVRLILANSAPNIAYFRLRDSSRVYTTEQSVVAATQASASSMNNRVRALPFFNGTNGTFTNFAFCVTIGGASTIRVAIYNNLSVTSPYPGRLLWESGNIAPIVGTNLVPIAPPVVSIASSLYWLCATTSGAATTYLHHDANAGSGLPPIVGINTWTNQFVGWEITPWAFGAFPATFPAGAVGSIPGTAAATMSPILGVTLGV